MEDHNLSPQSNAAEPIKPPVLPLALEKTAEVLRSVASESSSMEAGQKAQLRSKLLAEAHRQASTSSTVVPEVVVAPPVASTPTPEVRPVHGGPSFWKRWFALTGAGFAVAAFVLLLFVGLRPDQRGTTSLSRVDSVNRLLIPEAAASDAFTVYAEKSDVRGVEDDSAFILKSRVPLTVEQVRQTIQIVPSMPTDIESIEDGTSFRIRPQNQLLTGQVYRIALPTLVAKEDGTKTTRDFSWALQTREEVRVLSTIPGDGSSMVPVDTGIEFTLNHQGWENTTSSFEITPSVPGHMEVRGRRLVFVPEKPLQPGTRYEARLKQGLRLAGSDLSLLQDKRVRFETEEQKGLQTKTEFSVMSEFQEVFPGSDIQIPVYRSGPGTSTQVEVIGYSLSQEQALTLLRSRLSIPSWTQVQKNEFADYQRVATNRAFQLSAELRRPHEQAPEMLNLPKTLAAGWYAVSVQPQGLKQAWFFLQVAPIATYTLADKDRFLVWAVNASTNKPLSQVFVRLADTEVLTNTQGVAQLPTPSFLAVPPLTDPGDASPFDLMLVGKDSERSIVVVGPALRPLEYGRQSSALINTWGYLYPDRPLYRPTDEAMIFGLAQDRDQRLAPSNLEVRLTRSGFWLDSWTGKAKVYAHSALQPDTAGRFQAKLNWQNLTAGYYTLELLRDSQLIVSRSIELRDYVKPAYSLQIEKNVERVYAGQEIKATISAAFFDGTPVPRAKLNFVARQKYGQEKQQEVVLDENGKATMSVMADPVECGPNLLDTCRALEVIEMEVRPAVGEEGEIVGTATVEVYGSELDIRAEPQTNDLAATIALQTYRRQLSQDKNQTDVLGPVWSGRSVHGQLVGYYYERIQEGTYYDFIEKKVRPTLRYERRRDPPIAFELTTDTNGKANYGFRMNPARDYYELTLEGQDTQGRLSRTLVTVGHGWYEQGSGYAPGEPSAPKLEFKGHTQAHEYRVGEEVEVTYQRGLSPLEVARTPGVLFLTASRGLKETSVSNQPTYHFPFAENLVPNVEIRAVTFWNKRFEQVQGTAFLKRESRELTVEATPDQASYVPGASVKVKVTVKDKLSGQPAPRIKLGYAAVDKALLALSYQQTEDPLNLLYEYVPDGIVWQQFSHTDGLNAFTAGAEMGGGGLGDRGAGIRRLFKDTAAAGVVELNEQGEGMVSFHAPDNLTSWKVTLVALSEDVRAGASVVDVAVSKPLFVEAVLPPRLATEDKPVVKIRAFGAMLPSGTPVAFTLDAPTLGLNGFQATGTADVPLYVGISKLVPGRHAILVRVSAQDKIDTVEKWVQVEDTRFLKDEYVSLEATPGAALPSTAGSAEVQLLIAGKGRSALYPLVQSLSQTSSARLDARLAANEARRLLQDIYHEKNIEPELSVREYQDTDGGLRLLPYASSEVMLSTQGAVTSPQSVDQSLLADYLWSSLSHVSTTLEEQMESLSGLAALGQSVLPDLQILAQRQDLALVQRMAIVRGLVAAGDTERAGVLLRELLSQAERTDALLVMPVGVVASGERYAATAEAAALAAQLGFPEAEALERYVETHWSNEALPVLAKIRYLKARLLALPVEDGSVSWTLDGAKEESLQLKQEPLRSLTLSADEAKHFRVTQVSGPVQLEFIRRVPGRPSSVPGLSVNRSYEAPHPLVELLEGDLVRVTLTMHWQPEAKDGCYQLRDHLPGAWQAVTQSRIAYGEKETYPYEVLNGEVSFVVCKTQEPAQTITYLARVVSRGTYTAEAPLLQHMEYPSIAAVGKDESITVR